MTEKRYRWKSREWYGTTKTRWQQPVGSSGGQSSEDAWEHTKPKGKWKDVSAEYEALNALVKEKKTTWNKSGKESAKREADLYTMLDCAATDEKKEERNRDKLGDKLDAFPERKEEEDEATHGRDEEKTRRLHNTKVLRRSKVCAALFGSTSTRSTEIWGSPEDNDDKTVAIDAKPGN